MERPDPLEFIVAMAQKIIDADTDEGSGEDPDYYQDMLN